MKNKILIGVGILAIILVAAAFSSFKLNKNEPPPTLVASFVDLNKIDKISKYRSCAGHTTVPQDQREMKRNMKHYFEVKEEFRKPNEVGIYAPYSGDVVSLRSEPDEGLEGEIWIAAERRFAAGPPFGLWMFSVQHIYVRDDLKMGSKVKAGELIGYAALTEERGTFDVVYGKMGISPQKIDNWTAPFSDLDTIFYHMSQEVLTQFEEKGITGQNIILSKEEKDKNPCVYQDQGPYFINQDDSDNWVILE